MGNYRHVVVKHGLTKWQRSTENIMGHACMNYSLKKMTQTSASINLVAET